MELEKTQISGYYQKKFWKHTENTGLPTYTSTVAYSGNTMRFSITYPTNYKTEKVEATVIKRKKQN